jgi:succinylglutamic semialdehyde dehydrogenase
MFDSDSTSACLISGEWSAGHGDSLERISPVTGLIVWSGAAASLDQCSRAMDASHRAHRRWSNAPLEVRCDCVRAYGEFLATHRSEIARAITLESGKPLWESDLEISSAIAKIGLSIDAIHQRRWTQSDGPSVIRYRSHGPMVVLGPYNLPLHLPGAHIVPSLLAGNCVIFKPSEKSPSVGHWIARGWHQSGLPDGCFQMLHGNANVATTLLDDARTCGVLFTGSMLAGRSIHRRLAGRPEVLLALEMGGNNPMVVDQVSDLRLAVETVLQSAFMTSGQRCTCARRLVVVSHSSNASFVDLLAQSIARVAVGDPLGIPQPFMGPLVSAEAAQSIVDAQSNLERNGGNVLCRATLRNELGTLVSPGLTQLSETEPEDNEHFGPLLSVTTVSSLEQAIEHCNRTRYGLAAGLLSDHRESFDQFVAEVNAGIINWNGPTTGASGKLPFGGIGLSGNHHPSGYFAADYCSDPVASLEAPSLVRASKPPKGLEHLWDD